MGRALGFIGVGNMGRPMALRLLERGYRLVVHDVREEALRPLLQQGAECARSPADVACRADTVLMSLPTPEVVREVALGEEGLIRGSMIKVCVDLSTTGPVASEQIAGVMNKRGIALLDAPVSGGVSGAEKGTLTVMASGSLAVFKQVRAILEVIGSNIFYVGPKPGQGQMMKLVNNLLSATALAASSEALVLGVKAGLDPQVMLDVINKSSGRNSATQDKFPRSILPRTFDYGFKAGLMYKDVKLCLEQAEALGVPMWVGNAVRQLWQFAVSQGGADRDFTTIIQYIEAWAGVEVRGNRGPQHEASKR